MKKIIFLFVVFLSFAGSTFGQESLPANSQNSDSQKTVEVLDAEALQSLLKSEEGITILNFWATWCRPCVAELPIFENLHERYPIDQLNVVLVSLDFPDAIESKLLPFLEEKGIVSKVAVLDAGKPNVWIDWVDPEWSGVIPFTFIFDNSTNRKWNFAGEMEAAMLHEILEQKFKLDTK